jgi:hypothetical protein
LSERSIAIDQRIRADARQLTARAELGLADVLSPGAPVVRDALASMALEPLENAASVLQTATRRLPPPALGRLPFSADDGAPADLRFSPDGKFLIGLTGKFILGWRVDDRKQLLRHAIQGKGSFVGFNAAGTLAAVRLDQDVSDGGGKTELLAVDLAAAKVEQLAFSRVLDCAPQAGELRAVIAEADGRKLSAVALPSKQVRKEIELPAPATGRRAEAGKARQILSRFRRQGPVSSGSRPPRGSITTAADTNRRSTIPAMGSSPSWPRLFRAGNRMCPAAF